MNGMEGCMEKQLFYFIHSMLFNYPSSNKKNYNTYRILGGMMMDKIDGQNGCYK
jgi:hypothetical protein